MVDNTMHMAHSLFLVSVHGGPIPLVLISKVAEALGSESKHGAMPCMYMMTQSAFAVAD